MPWVALFPRAWPAPRPRLRLVKAAAPPPEWEALLALADAQAPRLSRALLDALTWETLPADVRQALLAGNGVQAAALLTLHVETQMNALYSPAVQQVAESLLRGVAIQQWETLRETLRSLEVPSPIPTKLPGDLLAPRAIEALQREGLRRVQGITRVTMDALLPPLQEGIAQGIPTPRIARELVPKIGLTTQQTRALDTYAESVADLPKEKREARIERKAMQLRRKRAMTIALTESHSMMNTAVDEFFQAASGAVGLAPSALKRFWLITEGSDRTCEDCKKIPGMNMQGRDFGEAFSTPKGPQTRPPLHPRCVPGDTLVLPGGAITAVSKRWYEGEMLVLHTALKKQLSCTPNHPILTRHGWVAAGLLKPGSEVVCSSGQEGIAADDNYIGDMPATIEQIVETYRFTHGVTSSEVPVAAEDFHGDGEGSKIAIIGADSLLRDDGYVSLDKPRLDDLFKWRTLADSLPGLGDVSAVLQREGFASDLQMRGGRLPLPLGIGHLTPLQQLCLGMSTSRHLPLAQAAVDDYPFNPKAFGESIDRLACEVVFDQLIDIQRYPFHGWVYNLQTENEWYICNGIMTHNCRCVIIVRPSKLTIL